jgi:hypothetical protein
MINGAGILFDGAGNREFKKSLYGRIKKLSLNLFIRLTNNKSLLMKRKFRILVITTVLLASFSVYPQLCDAQSDPAGDPDAPIDGGISLLLAAGVGYGLKKANDKRKNKKTVHLQEKE